MDIYLLTIVLTGIGGLACLVLAATGLRAANRLSLLVIGLISLGYVAYVLLATGEVWVFPFAALLPFGAIVSAFRGPRVRQA